MDSSIDLKKRPMHRELPDERGMTLVETMIAVLILLAGLLAMAQVLAFSVVASKTFGRDATKATALAHDKMEELTGLQFSDTTTNVTVAAPFPSNGVGLTAGGAVPPAAAITGYADYIAANGTRTTATAALYTRQWQIINDSANLKRIIVSVTSNRSFRLGRAPSTTAVTLKTP
ncbi:MAG TPA: prepilin-type N-terminal cleavage/methylation domain-containing protein [Acidobacteriota bacterium]|nr:prepilin-type N-terminal cleavage/methylation domain-containing protein [Acidobacteriota bacterium]